MTQKVLQLVIVGSTPPSLLRDLEDPIRAHLNVQAVQGRTHLQTPAYAFNKDRNQYHSNAVMRRMVPVLEPGKSFALGVLDVDLFIPDSPFVFGEADREAKIAVVSTFRLREGAQGETLRRRLQTEAVHQTAHLLGLSYCEDARCVMFAAASPQEVDRKGMGLCNLCRNELAKLNH